MERTPHYWSPDGGQVHIECYEPMTGAGLMMRAVRSGPIVRPGPRMARYLAEKDHYERGHCSKCGRSKP